MSVAIERANADQKPLLIDIVGLGAMLGRSVRSLERDDLAGRLPRPIRLGHSKRWRRDEINAWVEAGCPKRSAWEALRKPIRSIRFR